MQTLAGQKNGTVRRAVRFGDVLLCGIVSLQMLPPCRLKDAESVTYEGTD